MDSNSMSRVGWRVATGFLIFLLLIQINPLGTPASDNGMLEDIPERERDNNTLDTSAPRLETSDIITPAVDWVTGGDAEWLIDTATYTTGGSSLISGNIADTEDSWIETYVEGPVIISFDWRVSSETNYDYLRLVIDGTTRVSISGNQDWSTRTYTINSWGSRHSR